MSDFFSFEGRLARLPFWQNRLICAVLYVVIVFGGAILASATGAELLGAVAQVATLPVLGSIAANTCRRLHDLGKSGWWQLLFNGAPYIGITYGRLRHVSDGQSDLAANIAFAIGVTFSIWGLIELGLLRGTPGDNRYGPDPLAS